jgi:putative membrane protein
MSQNTTDRQLVTLVLVILGALLLLPVLLMGGMMGFGTTMGGTWGGHMWGAGQASGWMVLIGAVVQLVFLAAVVGVGYLLYRALVGSDSGTDEALEELRHAYARGDLTDEEYEQRRETLRRDT